MPQESSLAKLPIVNAMSVDVEDYFQVSAFEAVVPRERWGEFESRVVRNTERLLDLFDEAGIQATFFVLGWVADRYPGLVRSIAAGGHEIASHGYEHRLVYDQTPQQFRDDLRRARRALEAASGQTILGYRAPSYSITKRSLWAFEVLVEEGYLYDASVFPIHHDRYGIPDAPRHQHRVGGGRLWEVPAATVQCVGMNLPAGGGGYFRILPYPWTRWAFRRLNEIEKSPAVFYLHPWEIDPGQPRLKAPLLSRLRHYTNLDKTEGRLRHLLTDFRFAPLKRILSLSEPLPAELEAKTLLQQTSA